VAKFFFEEIGKIRFLKCEFGKKMLNKWNFFEKVYKPQKRKKKKKKRRENTDNICIWYTRYKYYALTKPASILVPSYKRFVFAFNY